MNIVSRGGSLVFAWMCMTGEENPFYEYYDEEPWISVLSTM